MPPAAGKNPGASLPPACWPRAVCRVKLWLHTMHPSSLLLADFNWSQSISGEIMGTLCLAEGADAAACAASRRAARRQHLMDGFDDEDGIEGAEAEYEDPEEM